MSVAATSQKSSSQFLWVLGAFAIFAVLLAFFLNLAERAEEDPRASERLANTAEIVKAQTELIAKMGLTDATKKERVFNETLELLKARKPSPSTQVVPGSPTQLKQAAASVPAAAPAAPIPAK